MTLHRWASNEDPDVDPFSGKDRCRACRCPRHVPEGDARARRVNIVAAGECAGPPATETVVIPLGPGVPS